MNAPNYEGKGAIALDVLDHVIPISRGGMNIDDNVQLLCPTCNLSKGAKTMEEWRERPQANVSR